MYVCMYIHTCRSNQHLATIVWWGHDGVTSATIRRGSPL